MRRSPSAVLSVSTILALAACGSSPPEGPAQPPGTPQPGASAGGAGPAKRRDGGLIAEEAGLEATLSLTIRYQAEHTSGIPNEGLQTLTFNHTTQLVCPLTSSDESTYSAFAVVDHPDSSDPFAATGNYQQWLNEECTGTLTISDTYHQDDPTLAGPEPVVRTAGTQPLATADLPIMVETDLDKSRTRYVFFSPSAGGFQREAAPGHPAELVSATAGPMPSMDFTVDGPIGGGQREVAVKGGKLHVDWTLARGGSAAR